MESNGDDDETRGRRSNGGESIISKENKIHIVSWNINGILKFQVEEIMKTFECSVLALQETKVTRLKLPSSIALIDNYSSYFSFNQHKAAFNGVSTYCHDSIQPFKAELLLSGFNDEYAEILDDTIGGDYLFLSEKGEQIHAAFADKDGRVVVTEHRVEDPDGKERRLVVFNLYSPYVNRSEAEFDVERTVAYKTVFHKLVSERAKALVEDGCFVLIVGDLNTVHKVIDQADDMKQETWSSLYGDRTKWMDDLLSNGFKDTFRLVHPNRSKAFTCWNTKLSCRENNYGTRLDYILCDSELSKHLLDADIHPDFPGSDHCPVSATFNLKPVPSDQLPKTATKFYPDFKMKQATLSELFQRCEKLASSKDRPASSTAFKMTNVSQGNNSDRKRKLDSQQVKQSKLSDFFTKKHKPASKDDDTAPVVPHVGNKSSTANEAAELSFSCKSYESQTTKSKTESFKWPNPPKVVLCKHNEPTVVKTVRKKGPNQGRSFYSCVRGKGAKDDPNGDCGFFAWR